MTSILFHLFFNPWALGAVAVIALIAVAIWFIPGLGPAKLLKIALDLRTWAVLAGILAVLGFAHQEKRYNEMKDQIAGMAQQHTADVDAVKTTEFRAEQKEKRTGEGRRIQSAIDRAKPGSAYDDVMDAIANVRGDPVAQGKPPIQVVPAPKLPAEKQSEPEVPNAKSNPPPAAERAPARPAPGPDGVRVKPEDVDVVAGLAVPGRDHVLRG